MSSVWNAPARRPGLAWPLEADSLLTPTHQSLKLLFREAHVLFGHLVVSVQSGLEDEWVICVERVVSLVVFEPRYGEAGEKSRL